MRLYGAQHRNSPRRSGVSGLSSILAVETALRSILDGFGWGIPCEVSYAPLDFPAVGSNLRHPTTCSIEVGDTLHLRLNDSATEVAHYYMLLARLPAMLWTFGLAREKDSGFAGKFMAVLGDGSAWRAIAFSSVDPGDCLIPDPFYFESLGFRDFRPEPPPWDARKPIVMWRGSTTGAKRYWPPRDFNDFSVLARTEMCIRAQQSPHLFDVGIVAVVQITDPAYAPMFEPLMRPTLQRPEYVNYKFLIDIDGNSDSWSRGLYCSLLLGCCMIKISSEYGWRSWYTDRLRPWEHYIPVKADLSDLEEKAEWAQSHDAEARQIAENGQRLAFSMHFLTEMDMAADRLAAPMTQK